MAGTRGPKLMERVRRVMRTRHYSPRTIKTYCYWTRYFIRYHRLCHPERMGAREVREFLSWLAVDRAVAASTQNQALNALVFLYRHVLEQPLGDIGDAVRARRPRRLPVVLTDREARRVIAVLGAPYQLLAGLMYGAGLRVSEAARLRVKDVELERRVITVRDGKGAKDRTTVLPGRLVRPLGNRIEEVRDAARAGGAWSRLPASLPFALKR